MEWYSSHVHLSEIFYGTDVSGAIFPCNYPANKTVHTNPTDDPTDEGQRAATPQQFSREAALFVVAGDRTRRAAVGDAGQGGRHRHAFLAALPRFPYPPRTPPSPINTLCAHKVRFVQSGLDLIGL